MANDELYVAPKNKYRMLRIKHILESETDEDHAITMGRIVQLLGDDKERDRRSLYDDIKALNDYEYSGIKVKVNKSKTPPEYSVKERFFSMSELKLLIDAIASSKFLTMDATRALINKLKSFCSRYEANELNRQTLLVNRPKRIDDSFHNNVSLISRAADTGMRITFKYARTNTKEKKQYNKKDIKVEPWYTLYADDKYYMIGYDCFENKRKNYLIDRMEDIVILDEKRSMEEEYEQFKQDMPFLTQSVFNLFGDKAEKRTVTLRCPEYYYHVIRDKFGGFLLPIHEKDRQGKPTEYITVDIQVIPTETFYAWIFGMNTRIKIVGPKDIKDEMAKMLAKVSSQYNRSY